MNYKKVSREHLYREVWSTPLSKLCIQYKMTDRALANLCARYHIPTPPRGFWQKLKYGKYSEQLALPPNEDPNLEFIYFDLERNPLSTNKNRISVEIELDKRFKIARKYKFHSRFDTYHKHIESSRIAFEAATKYTDNVDKLVNMVTGTPHNVDRWGHLIPKKGNPILNIAVSESCLERAILFMQNFILICEKVGWEIKTTKDRSTTVLVDGENFSIRLREQVKRHETKHGKYEYHEHLPTGELGFEIYHYGIWRDKSNLPIEKQLKFIIAGILKASMKIKQNRIERERAEEERRKSLVREQRFMKRQRKLEKAITQFRQKQSKRNIELISDAGKWRQANEIRDYIQHIESHLLEASASNSESIRKWIEWARFQADKIDPTLGYVVNG